MRLTVWEFAAGLIIAAAGCSGPSVQVESAVEISTLHQSSRVVGRDGAHSSKAFGMNVWDFGDTFLNVSNVEGFSFVSNTMGLSEAAVSDGGLDIFDVLDDAGAPSELLYPTPDELAYDDIHQALSDGGCELGPCGGRWATWPGPMAWDPESQSAVVFYNLIVAAPGDFNFIGVGQGLAVWSSPTALPQRVVPGVCPDQPLAMWCQDEPAFGTAAAVVDGMVYAFGCSRSFVQFPCELARAPVSQAANRSAWEYWTGNGFAPELSSAQSVFEGASIMEVFWNDWAQEWMAIYSNVILGKVVLRTAPAITGPWSGEGDLFTPNQKGSGGYTYDALPHPELAEQGGKVQYVTYSRGTGAFSSEFALVKVTFK